MRHEHASHARSYGEEDTCHMGRKIPEHASYAMSYVIWGGGYMYAIWGGGYMYVIWEGRDLACESCLLSAPWPGLLPSTTSLSSLLSSNAFLSSLLRSSSLCRLSVRGTPSQHLKCVHYRGRLRILRFTSWRKRLVSKRLVALFQPF